MRQKSFNQLITTFLTLLLITSLTSCEIMGDMIGDCIINSRPVLEDKELHARYNEEFSDFIHAYVKRDPNDNDYFYTFEVDNLPAGMGYYKDGIRNLRIVGKPIEKGTFTFGVNVRVDNNNPGTPLTLDKDDEAYDDGNTLCSESNYKTFTITVY